MEPDFKFSSLEISGFRGIPDLTLNLPDAKCTYLIGANNSGKSTVLNALALAVRGGGFHRFSPDEFDFFIDSRGERRSTFELRLAFEASTEHALPAVQGVGDPTYIHGVLVDGREIKGPRFEHRIRLYDREGSIITYSPRTPIGAKKKDQFKGQDVGWSPRNARLDDIRSQLPDVWLLTPENLSSSLYHWKTGPLQRISSLLSERFLQEEWDFKHDGTPRPMPETLRKVHEFFRASVSAFPFWKDDLRPKLQSVLADYLGRQGQVHLQPMVQTVEEWLAQQLAASFAADTGGAVTPLDRMGKGWQSLVRLAALDVLRTYPDQMREKVFLLFEEPETYLHPHLRRKLRSVLHGLAESGWQVVAATHAPEFVRFTDDQQIVRLWRDSDSVHSGVLLTNDIPAGPKFEELVDERGNHELLFANRIVLCEGKDDVLALETYLRKRSVDLDGRAVTVLGVGGVETLPHYARMAKELGISWLAITDEDLDADSGDVKPKTAQVRRELKSLLGPRDRCELWPGSLESVLNVPNGAKAKPKWQKENLLPLSADDIKASLPDFEAVGHRVEEWITA